MWARPPAAGGRAGQGSRGPCGVKGQYRRWFTVGRTNLTPETSGAFLFVSSGLVATGSRSPRPPGITYSVSSPAITAPGNGVKIGIRIDRSIDVGAAWPNHPGLDRTIRVNTAGDRAGRSRAHAGRRHIQREVAVCLALARYGTHPAQVRIIRHTADIAALVTGEAPDDVRASRDR